LQPNIDAVNNFFESHIAKQKNSVLINQNENLQFQKVKQELLYKSAALERSRAELQKVLAMQKVTKQENKIEELSKKNQFFAILLAIIILFLFSVLYFIFRLRKLNKIISERQRNKDRFFAMFSHDLRSQITNLKDSGMVLHYLIQNNRLNEIQDISRKLDLDGTQALLLLNNMLDWGILTGYSFQPTYSRFLLTNKVWDIIAIYKSEIDAKGKKLNIEIENDLYIYSDENSIDVILRNIIANAKSYTPEGGKISIRLEKHQTNQIAFIVTNSVKDFELGKLEHIQNVLSGEREPIAGHHGMGLGMVLIYEFAKNLDIKIEFSIENDIVTFKAIFYLVKDYSDYLLKDYSDRIYV
jgi:signal transduction histidine kinase